MPRGAVWFEMTLRERASRARLQIALEADGSLLISQLDRHHQPPRLPSGGGRAPSRIVVGQAGGDIRRQPRVRVIGKVGAMQNVDEPLDSG